MVITAHTVAFRELNLLVRLLVWSLLISQKLGATVRKMLEKQCVTALGSFTQRFTSESLGDNHSSVLLGHGRKCRYGIVGGVTIITSEEFPKTGVHRNQLLNQLEDSGLSANGFATSMWPAIIEFNS